MHVAVDYLVYLNIHIVIVTITSIDIFSLSFFSYFFKQLTHHILSKELRNCQNIEELDVNENVKHKAREYIKKYMSKFGSVYKKEASDL